MNNYEKERMKLWREVYVAVINDGRNNWLDAREAASDAVDEFDKEYGPLSKSNVPESSV